LPIAQPWRAPCDDEGIRHLLVVHHSRSGHTATLVDDVVAGAAIAAETVTARVLHAFDAGPDDVRWAEAIILATPANFGYMSGALKDFFERVFHPCLEETAGLPYGLLVKGDTDTDGAVASVERIATGLRWRRVLPALSVVGDATSGDVDQATELGATLAAGLAAGIF
jgi:NAD(P)H-dependent FMN reductase